ncbi:hypothetical protein LIA77_02121 [Sarocladium implicatum]|nr:hypothetical protein LIA77_02121 [Sarocladium implicatum]
MDSSSPQNQVSAGPSQAPSADKPKTPIPRTSSRATSSRGSKAETRFPVSPHRGRSRIASFGEDDDDEPPFVANSGNSPMLGQKVGGAKKKGKKVQRELDQDGFETIDLGKGKARETDEQDLGAQPQTKEKKRAKAKETLAAVKAKLQRTKEIKDPKAPRFGLGIFESQPGRPDPAHRELRLGHPTEELDIEAQIVRTSHEVWSVWEVAQAMTMTLTFITFILSAATLWALNHHE